MKSKTMTRQRPFAVLDGKPGGTGERQRAIEAELRALPDLAAPAELWQGIEQRVQAENARQVHSRTKWQALAAGMAAVSLTAVVLLLKPEPDAPQVAAVAAPAQVGTLMEHSRRIENERRALPVMPVAASVGPADARTILTQRVALVDQALNSLAAQGRVDPAMRQALWRERVELMNALLQAEQLEQSEFIRRAVY